MIFGANQLQIMGLVTGNVPLVAGIAAAVIGLAVVTLLIKRNWRHIAAQLSALSA